MCPAPNVASQPLLQGQMEDGVRVVVITGSGRVFCAGDAMSGRPRGAAGERLLAPIPAGHENPIGTYEGLRHLSQPPECRAAPPGQAHHRSDQRRRDPDRPVPGARLRLPDRRRECAPRERDASLRLLPDEGGQYLLVQHLGVARALDFLMRKRIVGAAEALALGLVNEVVPDGELLPRSLDLARELAEGPQVAMRLLKRSIYAAAELPFEHALDEIAAKTALSDHHPDAREGVAAWRERRAPRFNRWLEKAPRADD